MSGSRRGRTMARLPTWPTWEAVVGVVQGHIVVLRAQRGERDEWPGWLVQGDAQLHPLCPWRVRVHQKDRGELVAVPLQIGGS